jgi:hypothetical protein
MSLPFIAGIVSTTLFVISTLPMLGKALRTRELRSYSLGNILLANGGNLVHSIYIYSLPPGPIWLLHSFHLATTGLMLAWYTRYEWRPNPTRRRTRLRALRASAMPRAGGFSLRTLGLAHRGK